MSPFSAFQVLKATTMTSVMFLQDLKSKNSQVDPIYCEAMHQALPWLPVLYCVYRGHVCADMYNALDVLTQDTYRHTTHYILPICIQRSGLTYPKLSQLKSSSYTISTHGTPANMHWSCFSKFCPSDHISPLTHLDWMLWANLAHFYFILYLINFWVSEAGTFFN